MVLIESLRLKYHLIIFCGEFTGTGFLLYFGCLSTNDERITQTQAALAWGCAVTAVIMIFGHLTKGHFNPCVTTCSVILGLVTPLTALVYFFAEMLGAVFGYYLIYITLPEKMFVNATSPNTAFCLTTFHPGISVGQGMLAEFLATSLLIYAVCSAWDVRNAIWSDSVAIKFGFIVALLIYALGTITGASMNPARSFAPALIHNKWRYHWNYWVATMAGAIFTTVLYKTLYSAGAEEELEARLKLSEFFKQGSSKVEIVVKEQKKTVTVSPNTKVKKDKAPV